MATWQLQTAKNRFSELIEQVLHGDPQLITRNGKPVAYIIDCATYEQQIKAPQSKKDLLRSRPHKEANIFPPRSTDTGREVVL